MSYMGAVARWSRMTLNGLVDALRREPQLRDMIALGIVLDDWMRM